jgi:hypothetical protein
MSNQKGTAKKYMRRFGFLRKDALVNGVLDCHTPQLSLLRGFAYMRMMMDLDKEGSTAAIWCSIS